jgi:hypothetical protein
MKRFPLSNLFFTLTSAILSVAAWQWYASTKTQPPVSLETQKWELVRERFPMPDRSGELSGAKAVALESMVSSDPFSPMRGQATQQASEENTQTTATNLPEPQHAKFVYKGRILMGNSERAILEDLTTGKTYFLQVGQEVEGHKVLDILDTAVVLLPVFSKEPITLNLNQ